MIFDIALPIMNSLLQIVRDSHFLLVLTDSCGYIMVTMGDDTINKKAKDLKMEPGQLWRDEIVGSNAIRNSFRSGYIYTNRQLNTIVHFSMDGLVLLHQYTE